MKNEKNNVGVNVNVCDKCEVVEDQGDSKCEINYEIGDKCEIRDDAGEKCEVTENEKPSTDKIITSDKKQFCSECGTHYYQAYSVFCHKCGHRR